MKEVRELGNGKIEVDGCVYYKKLSDEEDEDEVLLRKIKSLDNISDCGIVDEGFILIKTEDHSFEAKIENDKLPYLVVTDDMANSITPESAKTLHEVISIVHSHHGGE